MPFEHVTTPKPSKPAIVSLDFWLWTGIGLCLSSMAVAVQPIYWLS
jgi:hypothetical protein